MELENEVNQFRRNLILQQIREVETNILAAIRQERERVDQENRNMEAALRILQQQQKFWMKFINKQIKFFLPRFSFILIGLIKTEYIFSDREKVITLQPCCKTKIISQIRKCSMYVLVCYLLLKLFKNDYFTLNFSNKFLSIKIY